jgi:hypothetical protein
VELIEVIGVIVVTDRDVPVQGTHHREFRRPINVPPTAVEALILRARHPIAVEVISR